jgi:hypothetical protein
MSMEGEQGRLKVETDAPKDSSLLVACGACADEITKAMRYHEDRTRGNVCIRCETHWTYFAVEDSAAAATAPR